LAHETTPAIAPPSQLLATAPVNNYRVSVGLGVVMALVDDPALSSIPENAANLAPIESPSILVSSSVATDSDRETVDLPTNSAGRCHERNLCSPHGTGSVTRNFAQKIEESVAAFKRCILFYFAL
jgi:hypothetical protein